MIADSEINGKLDKYFAMTESALTMLAVAADDKLKKQAEEFLVMARNYLSDARHFREKGDLLTSLAAVSYAHAWLDAGARLGLFRVDNSANLFTVD